jgi:penicillin amidase
VHDFYRDLVLEVTEGSDDEVLAEARTVARRWNGTADLDSIGLALLESYRRQLHRSVLPPLVEPCRQLDPGFRYFWLLSEEPLRRIVEERPPHLLPPGHADWMALMRDALRTALRHTRDRAPEGDVMSPWSTFNRIPFRHPLAAAAPMFANLLNLPTEPLPGHRDTVRVTTAGFGASMRMVASPGREIDALLHMPAGQCGHPLSPHYRDSHPAWRDGLATPLLAGETRATLRLVPEPSRK